MLPLPPQSLPLEYLADSPRAQPQETEEPFQVKLGLLVLLLGVDSTATFLPHEADKNVDGDFNSSSTPTELCQEARDSIFTHHLAELNYPP